MIKDLIDSITDPAIQFLQFVFDKLQGVSLVAARGLNLDYFLGPVAGLGGVWVALVKSVIACVMLLSVVFIATKGYGLYIKLKEGVQWW